MATSPNPSRNPAIGACAAALVLALMAACGGAGPADPPPTATAQANARAKPLRLRIDGPRVLNPDGTSLRLRGVNVDGVTDADAGVIADQFHMNLVRLRISFTPDTRDDTASGFKEAYLQQVDQWVQASRAHKLWMVLEMRANDNVANSPDFYDTSKTAACAEPTSCADFGYYLKAWKALAARYKGTDYIAGYGLLAEPSVNKTGAADPPHVLLNFQKTLMDAITAIDAGTPFFVGPDYNYDTMEYIKDVYFDELADKYRGRLVYEVNFLTPKEWIQDGSWTVGPTAPTYPFADPVDGYDSLLRADKPDDSMEKTYNNRRVEDGNYQKTLSKGLIGWYLQWPLQFRDHHQVPLYVDQFGASSAALGQLAYEGDLVDFFEAHDLHWTRWSYNAAGPDGAGRTLVPPNDAAIAFYTSLGSRWTH